MDTNDIYDALRKALEAKPTANVQSNNSGGYVATGNGYTIPAGWSYDKFTASKCYLHKVNELSFNGLAVVGSCMKCGERIEITSAPNSITSLRAKRLIEKWLTTRKLSSISIEEDSVAEAITEIRLLKAMLELDKDELELAKERLAIVEHDILSLLNEDMVDLQS